jgi:hypothetical protein
MLRRVVLVLAAVLATAAWHVSGARTSAEAALWCECQVCGGIEGRHCVYTTSHLTCIEEGSLLPCMVGGCEAGHDCGAGPPVGGGDGELPEVPPDE